MTLKLACIFCSVTWYCNHLLLRYTCRYHQGIEQKSYSILWYPNHVFSTKQRSLAKFSVNHVLNPLSEIDTNSQCMHNLYTGMTITPRKVLKVEKFTKLRYCIAENFEGEKFHDFRKQLLIMKILFTEISCTWHLHVVVEMERKS